MAGRLGTVPALVLGLVLVATGLAALPGPSDAEPRRERRTRTAQGVPPVIIPKKPPRHEARPVRAGPTAPEAPPTPEQVEAIARAQRCLADLGYYKGAVDGKRGKETWTAFWNFKQEHGLKSYSDLLAEPVQQKLDELCKKKAEEIAKAERLADPLYQPEGEEASDSAEAEVEADDMALASTDSESEESVPVEPKVRLEIDCLPEDLIALLQRAHGPGVAVKSCERACLPSPKGLPQAELDDLQKNTGVVWCRACVPIQGQLTLDDVLRIERAGNVQLCATPSQQLPRHGSGAGDGLRSYTRVRELYRGLPPAAEDPDAVAVIIGNRSYAKLPPSVTSYNDADAIYSFLTEHLGYRPDNILDVRDAKKADLERLFGREPGLEGDLSRLVQSQPNARVLVYYSGHGATDAAQNETYLLPVDTEAFRDEQGGYKLSTLYANLAKLDARSVLVLLETEYGRDHGPNVLPPNLPETMNTALPRAPVPALTVLAASDRGQRTLIDVTYDIGLFTRYLIEGLAGGADLAPIGNGDGKLDSAEIYVFTATLVDLAARKTFGLLQQPIYSSAATSVLTSARTAPAGSN
ncbi:MAG TPA: caspase family protein [Methyloceanibacter sp.]